jgi:hypothetical protein
MNLDDLDTLVMEADPAREVRIPSAWSVEAQRSYLELTARSYKSAGNRKALVVVASVVGTIAAALVLVVAVVSGPSGQQSAAAAVLGQAATKAGEQANVPKAHQYLFSETRTRYEVVLYADSRPGQGLRIATAQFIETDRVWINAQGEGRVLRTESALQFPSAKDRALWNASPVGQQVYQTLLNNSLQQSQVSPKELLVNVSDLPTNTSQLQSVLANDTSQTNIDHIPAGRDAVFERAAVLLLGPDFGMSPHLASALFHVMAKQPGTHLVGALTAHSGRTGDGIVLSTSVGGHVSEVVVAPGLGSLLELSFVLPSTTISSGETRTCISPKGEASVCTQEGNPATLAPVWTDLVSTGIVSSERAMPSTS